MMIAAMACLILISIMIGQKHSIAHKQQKIEQRARRMGHELNFSE